LFFAAGFVEEVYRSATASEERLLDAPQGPGLLPLHFFERTYPHDDLVSPALARLRALLQSQKPEQVWLEEQFHEAALRLLQMHQGVRREAGSLPAHRPATREELYRRLHLARDYAAASYAQPVSLDELARIACLSPNHFLRSFKGLFHQTPYQFLIDCRLERASWLLVKTSLPVTEICLSVGFQSLGSFSSLFRRSFGLAPQQYRREFR
jgi:AraC-like DNA-binding protein